jgi:hypothetical protein
VTESGRLTFVSSTQLKFAPYKGDRIKINGTVYAIPSAGIAGLNNTGIYLNGVAGQNLVASGLYYVYCFNNAGVLTADFSTGRATSATAGNVGTEIKSGDDTRSLIGMIYTTAANQFSDAPGARYVRSWFNRAPAALTAANSFSGGASTVWTGTGANLFFVLFADDVADITGSGYGSNTAITTSYLGIGIDSTTVVTGAFQGFTETATGGYLFSLSAQYTGNLAEGFHAMYGIYQVGGGALTLTTNMFGVIH